MWNFDLAILKQKFREINYLTGWMEKMIICALDSINHGQSNFTKLLFKECVRVNVCILTIFCAYLVVLQPFNKIPRSYLY